MVCKHKLNMQLRFPHQARPQATYITSYVLLSNLELRLSLSQNHDKQAIFDNFTTAPEQKASQAQQNARLPNLNDVVLVHPDVAASNCQNNQNGGPVFLIPSLGK